jgi:hypothetical protein
LINIVVSKTHFKRLTAVLHGLVEEREMRTRTKVLWIVLVLVVIAAILSVIIACCSGGGDEDPKPKGSAAKSSATGPTAPTGDPTLTETRVSKGMPAEIGAAGKAVEDVVKAGGEGKLHVHIVITEKKKAPATSRTAESKEVREARVLCEGFKEELGRAKREVLRYEVQFGKNGFATNNSRAWYDRTSDALSSALDNYEEVLKGEGYSEAEIKARTGAISH